nr:hypothetical protein [Tanacetum cinerariifolium]
MTTPTVTSSTDSQMYNNIMAAVQAVATTVLVQAVAATDDSPAIPEHTTVETLMNMSPENKAHFQEEKETIHLILTGIRDEIYSTVDVCQTTQEIYKGKEIAKPITPPSETASEEDSDPEQAQRDKDMQKNLALIAKYFKKIYKPTNNNLKTSSNSRNKNVDTTPRVLTARNLDILLRNAKSQKGLKTPHTYKEIDEQELEAHYSYMAKIQEVPTADTSTDSEPLEQIQKQLKKANTTLAPELKECKTILAKTSKTLRESNRVRDSCLVALQNKQTEFEKYKAFNDRTVGYDKLERKLNETLGQLAQKYIEIKEGLKTKAYEIAVVKEKHDELIKQSLLTKSHYEGLVKQKTKVITDLKLREEHDIDKMLSMEKQLKFLNEIVYKRSQSIQIIHMMAPKVPTYNGRPAFANPRYLKQAQSEIPCLYAFPYDQSTHANRLILDGEETLALERESRSKLNKDLTCLMSLAIKTQNDIFIFVHELEQEMHVDLKYVESLEKEIDELESDKAEFSNMYDMILQECVSNDVMCSYLLSLSDLDALAKLQCLYLHKVQECDCLAQKLSKQTESISKVVHTELLQCFAKVEKHSISLKIALQKCKEHVENDAVWNEKASNVFQKEREQYIKIQDLKAQLQDKNIEISELKKLIKEGKGKSMETKFDKPSVVRQPNAQRIPKPSVLCKPTPFSNSLERRYFSKTNSVPKTNVSKGLSKPVTTQTLPQTARQVVSNTNVLKPRMYRIDNKTTQTRSPQSPQTVRNTNPRVSTSTRVNHNTNVSRPQHRSIQLKDKIVQLILFIVDSRCTKHMTGNLELLCNFVESFWVLFVLTMISLRQFLVMEIWFKEISLSTRDLQGNDLLIGNRRSDLYTISLQESTSSTLLYLMAKASTTQASLWHRRLSHLNFDYINLLSKKDVVIGLTKLKYVKD